MADYRRRFFVSSGRAFVRVRRSPFVILKSEKRGDGAAREFFLIFFWGGESRSGEKIKKISWWIDELRFSAEDPIRSCSRIRPASLALTGFEIPPIWFVCSHLGKSCRFFLAGRRVRPEKQRDRRPINFMARKLLGLFDRQGPQFVESLFQDTQKKGGGVLTIEKIDLYLLMKRKKF